MNWSGLNVLITGGAGHIGSNLALELIKKDANIRIADNLWRGKKELQDLIFFLTFSIPIFITIILYSTLYDGWRHLYFIYPFAKYL